MATLALEDFLSLGPLVVNFASMIASAVLLCWISALKAPHAAKLMSRQLWHLSLADFLDSLLQVPWWGLDCLSIFFRIGQGRDSPALNALCSLGHLNFAFIASMLVEVHIALAVMFSLCRSPTALRVLYRGLPFVWLIGCVLGALIFSLSWSDWDAHRGTCVTPMSSGEWIKNIIMVGSIMTVVLSYLGGLCYVNHSGEAVLQRVRHKASIFVLTAVVSWLPFVVLVVSNTDADTVGASKTLYFSCWSLTLSNGLLNAIAYAMQCRSLRCCRRSPTRSASSERRDVTGTLNVAFADDASEVEVSPVASLALRTAEAETRELEASRAARRARVSERELCDPTLLSCFDDVSTQEAY